MTRATASQPSQLGTSWGISTLTVTAPSTMPWFACLRTGKTVRFSLRCTGTMAQWTVIPQRLCVILRRACLKWLAIFCRISRKIPFLLLGTLTILRRSLLFCRQPFLIFWSMEQLGFPQVMRRTFHPIILPKSLTRSSI